MERSRMARPDSKGSILVKLKPSYEKLQRTAEMKVELMGQVGCFGIRKVFDSFLPVVAICRRMGNFNYPA